METHRPKPLHRVSEFLQEVGIIVLGVLIALGAQQTVDQLRWAGEVRRARASLKSEIEPADRIFAFRIAAAPCVDRRLDTLQAVTEAAASRLAGPRLGPVGVNIGNGFGSNIWQSYRASQTLIHFKAAELIVYGAFYSQSDVVTAFMAKEGDAWDVLKTLKGDPRRLSAPDFANIRAAIEHARTANAIIADIAADQLERSRSLGITPPAPDQARIARVCAPQPRLATAPLVP